MSTKLKVVGGSFIIRSMNDITGETVVHIEAWYVDNCRVEKWFSLEPKTEIAFCWLEQNGFPNIRKEYMIHFKSQAELLKVLRKAEKEI
ncbi:MAG: hypothetical protein PHC28_04835 [Flavobacterium sp.]|uniref:hypothetical protein n=1 Tax=Flavobacterium sp. TaxID=239 RepID=UPI00261FBE09|nr:hypothetical protein [Flavobacterium sp.]MDD5149791.1 hypothetical protein [Flavobacterium sp.]